VTYTTTIDRELPDGSTIPLYVEYSIIEGQVGVRSGHPDRWTEDIPDEIEVTSALVGDTGIETNLTDDEMNDLWRQVEDDAEAAAEDAAVAAYEGYLDALEYGLY